MQIPVQEDGSRRALTQTNSTNIVGRPRDQRHGVRHKSSMSMQGISENIPPSNIQRDHRNHRYPGLLNKFKKPTRNSSSIPRVKESVKNIFQGTETPSMTQNSSKKSLNENHKGHPANHQYPQYQNLQNPMFIQQNI